MLYVVDDAQDYRFLVQQVFRLFLAQYPLRLFEDGLALIHHLEQPSARLSHTASAGVENETQPLPKLLILDVDMPKLDGWQTLERLKQVPRWQALPVVMMSNRLEAPVRQRALELGAIDYMTKPLDLPALRQTMGQLCQQWLDEIGQS